jgi:hypothetical protein
VGKSPHLIIHKVTIKAKVPDNTAVLYFVKHYIDNETGLVVFPEKQRHIPDSDFNRFLSLHNERINIAITASTSPIISMKPGKTAYRISESTIVITGASPVSGTTIMAFP